MASTHMNSMLSMTWTLESFSKGAPNKRKAQVEELGPGGNMGKTLRSTDAPQVPEGVPLAGPSASMPQIGSGVPVAPGYANMLYGAPGASAPWPSALRMQAPPQTPWQLSTPAAPPKPQGPHCVKWAKSMGRSKKAKEVERMNHAETLKYQQNLVAHHIAQEVAQREAIAHQQTKVAQHVAEAAAKILTLVPGLAQLSEGGASELRSLTAAASGAATGATTVDETATGGSTMYGAAKSAADALAAARANGLLAAAKPADETRAAEEPSAPPVAPADSLAAPTAATTDLQGAPFMDAIASYLGDMDAGLLSEIVDTGSSIKTADIPADWAAQHPEAFDSLRRSLEGMSTFNFPKETSPRARPPPKESKPRTRRSKKADKGAPDEPSIALQAALAHSEELQNDAETVLKLLVAHDAPPASDADTVLQLLGSHDAPSAPDPISSDDFLTMLNGESD